MRLVFINLRRILISVHDSQADKCKIIHVSQCKTAKPASIRSSTQYKIHCQTLKVTGRAQYQGIIIDCKLSWNAHVEAVSKKANNTLSFLRRNLSACPKDVKATCYKSLVRPQLEYVSTLWDPHTKKQH